jgi:hypothetical protein
MRLIHTHEGRQSEKGWLVLDVRGLDLDGVNALVIPIEEIERLQEGSQQQANPLAQLQNLLGRKEGEP